MGWKPDRLRARADPSFEGDAVQAAAFPAVLANDPDRAVRRSCEATDSLALEERFRVARSVRALDAVCGTGGTGVAVRFGRATPLTDARPSLSGTDRGEHIGRTVCRRVVGRQPRQLIG